MVSLLGSGDELLRVIEDVVSADFHVRGNEITITGPDAEVAVASRLRLRVACRWRAMPMTLR